MNWPEFGATVAQNTEYLKPYAVTFTKDHEAARDLVQETLYKALANSSKYQAGTNLKAWLYTIMRNIFINNYRKQSKHHIVSNTSGTENFFEAGAPIAENEATSTIKIKEIKKAIHDLPNTFRLPFLLHFEGYKYYEISDMLKEPLGTVKSRIHFARKMLKDELILN